MIRSILWKLCHFFYVYLAKPILFLIPPDKVHESMIAFSAVVAKVPAFRGFVGLIFKRRPDSRLKQDFNGLRFNNPVGLSAGFDKNGQIMPTIAALGFGFGEVGSVTAQKCAGNPRPWFYRLPKTMSAVVNAGLANDGSATIIARIKKYSAKSIRRFPIVLSIAKTNSREVVSEKQGIDDYVTTLKRAKNEKNISMVELNISCPNTFGGEPFTAPACLNRLLNATDKVKVGKPIYVKMPVDLEWKEFRALLDVIAKHDVAGVTISNLFKDRSKVDLLDDLPDTVEGNLSGKPTWERSNELIRQTYINYGDKLTIIGVGGIFSATDAYTKIRSGASLVEIITGVLFKGPQLAAEINDGLLKLMKRDGYTNISQVVGVDAGMSFEKRSADVEKSTIKPKSKHRLLATLLLGFTILIICATLVVLFDDFGKDTKKSEPRFVVTKAQIHAKPSSISSPSVVTEATPAPDYLIPSVVNGLDPVITNLPTKQKVVFLGIDDGAFKDQSVVDIMQKNHIKASLFLAKSFIASNPSFFQKLIDEGSLAEDHSLTHDTNMVKNMDYSQMKAEICGMADYEMAHYGRRPVFFRPPGGAYSNTMRQAAADCGMKAIVTWIAKANGGSMQYQIGNFLRPGDVVLMHFRPEFKSDMQAFVDAMNASGLHTELLENAQLTYE